MINFHRSRNFKFQSFLIKMFLNFNEDGPQLPEMFIIGEMCKDYSKFLNILMAPMYEVLLQQRLPRVLPAMKNLLQFSLERRVGD